MSIKVEFTEAIKNYTNGFHSVVPFNKAADKLLLMDFTENNKELTDAILMDTARFSDYINNKLQTGKATYGIGGYNEHRTIYRRSELFSLSPALSGGEGGGVQSDDWADSLRLDGESVTVEEFMADPVLYGKLKEFAATHRHKPTMAEDLLWDKLRAKKGEHKFRRQHIIDQFIADFVCLKKRLVIELDGSYHQLPEVQISDEQRTQRLNELGFQVLRFTNDQILYNLENTLQQIQTTLSTLLTKELYPKKQTATTSSPTGGGREGARRLHLGVDIWGKAGIPVYAPLKGQVHSFRFNDNFGDYGATLILQHSLGEIVFHTIYGHLSLQATQNIREGQEVDGGERIAAFGEPEENGHWPPHLHFQLILDMQGYKGDYPGVCAFSERKKYLANSPDPDLILQMLGGAVKA